jgi:hypothetical protein
VKAPAALGRSIGHDDDVPGDERVRAYYRLFKSLAEVYLEDSWVLEVDERGGSLVFDLEVVLTERHAFYGPPQPGEMHCYRRGQLIVRSPLPISLRRSGNPPARTPLRAFACHPGKCDQPFGAQGSGRQAPGPVVGGCQRGVVRRVAGRGHGCSLGDITRVAAPALGAATHRSRERGKESPQPR